MTEPESNHINLQPIYTSIIPTKKTQKNSSQETIPSLPILSHSYLFPSEQFGFVEPVDKS